VHPPVVVVVAMEAAVEVAVEGGGQLPTKLAAWLPGRCNTRTHSLSPSLSLSLSLSHSLSLTLSHSFSLSHSLSQAHEFARAESRQQ
jgi:hypothetical protein